MIIRVEDGYDEESEYKIRIPNNSSWKDIDIKVGKTYYAEVVNYLDTTSKILMWIQQP